MGRDNQFRIGAIGFRLFLWATMMAIFPYAAVAPSQMYKNTAICVLVGIASYTMVVQVMMLFVRYMQSIPYNIWFVIAIDSINTAGWIAAIAVMSYWDLSVLYKPHKDDPASWLECANIEYWQSVLTDDGWGKWLHLVWCPVEVDGQNRLIGNSAARTQHEVLIGLATISLMFDVFILLWTVIRGRRYGVFQSKEEPVPHEIATAVYEAQHEKK